MNFLGLTIEALFDILLRIGVTSSWAIKVVGQEAIKHLDEV